MHNAEHVIAEWPEESREAAQLVIDAHGEPAEHTESMLIWYDVDGGKRLIASRDFAHHDFPVPHTDSVTTFIDYAVPTEFVSALAEFDGSVTVYRTAGEVSATCHDEQANFLALGLVQDIVHGVRDVDAAREYYKKEFLDHRRGKPTPYMRKLRVTSASDTADPDERIISESELEEAVREGESKEQIA